jgi:hypothetical protein
MLHTNYLLSKPFIKMISPLFTIHNNQIYNIKFQKDNIHALFSYIQILERFGDSFLNKKIGYLYLSINKANNFYFIEEQFDIYSGFNYYYNYSFNIKKNKENIDDVISEAEKIFIIQYLKENFDLENNYKFYDRI